MNAAGSKNVTTFESYNNHLHGRVTGTASTDRPTGCALAGRQKRKEGYALAEVGRPTDRDRLARLDFPSET